jgi:NAD(P)-dependent dehydrogenase (short-subunit alcohol dehydrogenase family)
MLCAQYGKGHITQSLTVTSGSVVQKPMAGLSFGVGGGGALLAVVRNLAIDLAPLRVNCIAPGLVVTEMYDVCSKLLRGNIPLTASNIGNNAERGSRGDV